MKKFRTLKTEDQFQLMTFVAIVGFLTVVVINWAVNGFITTL